MTRSLAVVCLASLVVFFAAPRLRADDDHEAPPANCVDPIRAELRGYDLRPHGTLRLLGELTACLAQPAQDARADEARFVRAAVASDLSFVATFSQNTLLRDRLAQALGVGPEGLHAFVASELEAVARGVYADAARAALSALDARVERLDALVGQHGVRADALRVRLAARAASTPNVGGVLAAAASDPCSDADVRCPEPFSHTDTAGRRALSFMQELSAALARLEEAERLGDPLAGALSDATMLDAAKLRALVVRLPPALPNSRALALEDAPGPWPVPSVIVLAGERELRLTHAPAARLSPTGVELVVDRAPTLPQSAALAAIGELEPSARPFDALVSALAAHDPGETRSVGVWLHESLSAQVLSRVALSLRRADVRDTCLLVSSSAGTQRLPLRVNVVDPKTPAPSVALYLRVRLGGYSLRAEQGFVDIPRVQDGNGFHFDLDALRSAVGGSAPASAAISFMPEVASGHLIAAALRVRPADRPLELVVQ